MMDIMRLAQMGGGPASYIPAHTSSALQPIQHRMLFSCAMRLHSLAIRHYAGGLAQE